MFQVPILGRRFRILLTASGFEIEQFVIAVAFWQISGIGVFRQQVISDSFFVTIFPSANRALDRVLVLGTSEPQVMTDCERNRRKDRWLDTAWANGGNTDRNCLRPWHGPPMNMDYLFPWCQRPWSRVHKGRGHQLGRRHVEWRCVPRVVDALITPGQIQDNSLCTKVNNCWIK